MQTQEVKPIKGNNALAIIRRQFPQVKQVVDAKKTISIQVTPQDCASGRKKDPNNCAMVKACVRTKIAEAAIVGVSYSYLIKGDKATRYKTSVGVGREITSFDRNQEFAEGDNYKLSKVAPSNALGKKYPRNGKAPRKSTIPSPVAVHRTANIRVIRKSK